MDIKMLLGLNWQEVEVTRKGHGCKQGKLLRCLLSSLFLFLHPSSSSLFQCIQDSQSHYTLIQVNQQIEYPQLKILNSKFGSLPRPN